MAPTATPTTNAEPARADAQAACAKSTASAVSTPPSKEPAENAARGPCRLTSAVPPGAARPEPHRGTANLKSPTMSFEEATAPSLGAYYTGSSPRKHYRRPSIAVQAPPPLHTHARRAVHTIERQRTGTPTPRRSPSSRPASPATPPPSTCGRHRSTCCHYPRTYSHHRQSTCYRRRRRCPST